MGPQIFLDYSPQKSQLAQLVGKASGNFIPRTYRNSRLGLHHLTKFSDLAYYCLLKVCITFHIFLQLFFSAEVHICCTVVRNTRHVTKTCPGTLVVTHTYLAQTSVGFWVEDISFLAVQPTEYSSTHVRNLNFIP